MYNKLEHISLKYFQKWSLSFSSIAPYDSQGWKNCCLIVFVITCEATLGLQSIHSYTFKLCKNHTKDSWIRQESHQHSKNPLADLENH